MSKNKNTYAARISKDEKTKDAEKIAYEVESAELQINNDLFKAKNDVTVAKRNLEEAKSAVPFDSKVILEMADAADDAVYAFDKLTAIKAELFGAEE